MKKGITKKHRGQMSEAFVTAVFLSMSGGLQDVYTYLYRDGVFANAQTGNIVLLSTNLFAGNWAIVPHYIVPISFFAFGVWATEEIRRRFGFMQRLHWRQLVVAFEFVLLFAVGFMPQSFNVLANAIVSFSCAMQVQAFRKVDGFGFASTMCIGNLRSGMEALCAWQHTRDTRTLEKSVKYFSIIILFAVGAGIGSVAVKYLEGRAIWLSCALLSVCFALMFIKDELAQEAPKPERILECKTN